ncbi:TonB-dependent receptor [uncultured Zhongshania sp.]|uniref:TonB-dependent receptor n=1 Tax=uncultured Zhongshania sp. TaxID=1642288 RepID=UPI0025E80477|nr:TonB-dependent receptor [uncultured Zhongshania sp.]
MKSTELPCSLPLTRHRFSSQHPLRFKHLALAAGIAASLGNTTAVAQTQMRGSAATLMEEVIVTARKRDENSQDVPILVSAYNSDQLDALKVRNMESLSVGLPNVSLDDAGTAKGYANFSIRGLGINSSILSIDPTVGIFVDGVYMGVSSGMVFDVFDLESVEVLRGPQGTLFGRNVTGGAILMNTKKPGDEFAGSIKAAVDGGGPGGLNKYLMGTIGGPITDTVGAKFTMYFNDDDGWFENQLDGEDFGAAEQEMIRGVVTWQAADNTDVIFRWEHAKNDSDGPAGQNHRNGDGVEAATNAIPGVTSSWDRNSHDFSIDERGFYNTKTDFMTLEINHDVAFGDGTITNITGWRTYEAQSLGDIDSQPFWIFHSSSWTEQDQVSNELRYTGRFAEKANLTTGIFYFNSDLDYHERRLFGPNVFTAAPISFDGGGIYGVETWAIFSSLDYDVTESLILNLGLRYSYEEKEARIATLPANSPLFGDPTCNIVAPSPSDAASCQFDFEDSEDWSNWSPKIGMTYLLSDDARLFAHWTRSFRSGGYNLRNTALPTDTIPAPYDSEDPADIPGPFDEETVDNFELGFKSEFGRSRLNAAVFYNQIKDMQRELNFPGALGTNQLIRNTADAQIFGIEIDGAIAVTDSLLLTASIGWLDAEYQDVKADLNGDGNIDSEDEDLDLPRAPELTYSVGVNHDLSLGSVGYIASRISYAFRDESAYTDNNKGFITEQKMLNAGVDFHTNDESWVVGIYGNNLLDDVKHGGDTQLPASIGGTFAPLAKGRVIGLEVTYKF